MHYSFIIFCILSIIKVTSAFDENNQFKNNNYNNKHELLTPCGHMKSIGLKFHNTTKYLKNSKVNITYYNIYFVLFIIVCLYGN